MPRTPPVASTWRLGGAIGAPLRLLLLAGSDAGSVVLALGIRIAIDELDDGSRCAVAETESRLQHAGISASSILVTGTEHIEQLLGHLFIAEPRRRKPARVEIAALCERDVLVHHAPQVLGLRQGRHDLLVADEGCSHVGEHRLAMPAVAAELPAEFPVSHCRRPSLWLLRGGSLASPLGSE